jgi:hypothetical protein
MVERDAQVRVPILRTCLPKGEVHRFEQRASNAAAFEFFRCDVERDLLSQPLDETCSPPPSRIIAKSWSRSVSQSAGVPTLALATSDQWRSRPRHPVERVFRKCKEPSSISRTVTRAVLAHDAEVALGKVDGELHALQPSFQRLQAIRARLPTV